MQTHVRMITTAEHQYAGHRLHPGEEYDCEAQHVPVMQRHGWARPKATEEATSQGYQTRDLVAEPPRGVRRLRK